MAIRWAGILGSAALVACGGAPSSTATDAGGADAAPGTPDATPLPVIPPGTVPCDAPQYWPLSIRSTAHPAIVHYRSIDEEATAREVLGYLDHAWTVEVGQLGFRPPIDDAGRCGPDGAFDVYLWRGLEECYVDVVGENDATPYDDEDAYLVVDPWGPFGGAILDTTVAHELNHAMQAADDWSDSPIAYEMTSVFVEDQVYDDDNQYVAQIADFQAHPEWSLDRDDGYETWYMYGAALYLRFVRDRYFSSSGAGDGAFVGEMWQRLRSPLDAEEPDFEDALDAQLRARAGVGFLDSVVEFAVWRVYTGARADAAHLEEAASFAEPARAASVPAAGGSAPIAVMVLGTAYVDVTGTGAFDASLDGAGAGVTWVVQTVATSGGRTIAVTALPKGSNDPDARTDALHHATLVVAPR